MHMTPTAKPAWDRLTAAMEHTIPDCENDDRYIADILENGAKKELGLICTACPLLELCTTYAVEDRPRGGWWPEHNLKNIKRKAPTTWPENSPADQSSTQKTSTKQPA